MGVGEKSIDVIIVNLIYYHSEIPKIFLFVFLGLLSGYFFTLLQPLFSNLKMKNEQIVKYRWGFRPLVEELQRDKNLIKENGSRIHLKK